MTIEIDYKGMYKECCKEIERIEEDNIRLKKAIRELSDKISMIELNSIADIEKNKKENEHLKGIIDEFNKLGGREEIWRLKTLTALMIDSIKELERTIAVNKYVVPPYDIGDDCTAELAVQLSKAEERIIELEKQIKKGETI